MVTEVEQIVTRLALKAVLDVERSLGPWDVKIRVHGAENRITGLFQGYTSVEFSARGRNYAYKIDLHASDFRSRHLAALMP
ncbi:hypothetical protein EVC03_086 [Rhizobium phage RHph_Y5A]|nr:hypothetical protein EVC03_086 [Rhizobium phage RHph_Y5A]QIG75528.1 hypothetical protein EVC18_086 [Rhizobium phage RHph_Y2_4]